MKQIKDDKLLHALLTCGTVKEASVHLGCCQSTIYAKLKEPEFKAKFDELRQEVLKETTNALQVASLDAVAVLRELANNKGANPQSRIYACTIEELEANPDACFIKVLKGNNISEVDKVLKHIEIVADRTIDDEQRLVKAN